MSEKPDTSNWEEATIRTPGMRATPDQINSVLRSLFDEDAILEYQRRVAEAGLREAVGGYRRVAKRRLDDGTESGQIALRVVEGVLISFDPDHEQYDGYFPSALVCPLHGQPERPTWNPITPVFKACPGIPWCKAHEGVRVE